MAAATLPAVQPPRVASLFSGILAGDLGLHAAGAVTAWTSEIDPFCRRIIDLWIMGRALASTPE